MKIGLCGTMSVGKTTLVKALKETKQFKNAIDLLQECEERHRRNEKKLSRVSFSLPHCFN